MINIRSFLGFNESYFYINREERNFAAILYHLLLVNNNLPKFMKLIECDFPIVENEFAIYFEYSFLRDIWFNIKDENDIKRKFILGSLKLSDTEYLSECNIETFNKYFGAVPNPSIKYIQSPSNWSIEKYKSSIKNDSEFLEVSQFKWAFNAKPDIVIHTSNNTAICIETKFESAESYYPSKTEERLEFSRRNLSLISQTQLQKRILTELLGIETQFIMLVQKSSASNTHTTIYWKDVFGILDLCRAPYFITEWLKRL